MTSSIPDSISSEALEAFAKKAEEAEQCTCDKPLYDGLTASEVQELAMETLRGMTRKCKDPMVEKCMMLAVAMSWVKWHTEMAQHAMLDVNTLDDEAPAHFATCLLRDAGKAQAVYTLVHDISMDNDFILGPNPAAE